MKLSTAFAFAALTLLTSVVFAHDGDVSLRNGDVRVGHYKLISIANNDVLFLDNLTCNVSKNSQTSDLVENIQRRWDRADLVDVSGCYPSNLYAHLMVNRLSETGKIDGYNYILSLELANTVPRFPLSAYSTEHHSTLGRCTQNQNRLTCSLLGGGEMVLDLL